MEKEAMENNGFVKITMILDDGTEQDLLISTDDAADLIEALSESVDLLAEQVAELQDELDFKEEMYRMITNLN